MAHLSSETVTASEIAEWVFYPEAIRLSFLGHKSANQSRLEVGTTYHTHKATAERTSGDFIALGRILIILAILGVLVWLFFSH
jgi:hypothetical protein